MPSLFCLETTVAFNWILSSNLSVVNDTSFWVFSKFVIVASVPLWTILENWKLVLFVITVFPFSSFTLNVYLYLSPTFSTVTSFSNKLAYVDNWELSFWYLSSPLTVVGKVLGILSYTTSWSGTAGASGFLFSSGLVGVVGLAGLVGTVGFSSTTGFSTKSLAVS